jgi:N-acetylmuramoyl-L-alanine amidase
VKKLFILSTILSLHLSAQTIQDCRLRFDRYLNFKGSLGRVVRFEPDRILILTSGGKAELIFYQDELPVLSDFFQTADLKSQDQLMKMKGTKKLSNSQLDSLKHIYKKPSKSFSANDNMPLKGYKIAIDPGHSGTNLQEAKLEQKYLYFATSAGASDSVKLFESALTFNTASLLKKMLEDKGAEVLLTRAQADYTAFDCTLTDWLKFHKKRSLDSLKQIGQISPSRHQELLKCTDYKLFWDFFRDYDLSYRASKINVFKPDVTLIVHYNVDEKNVPWQQFSPKDFTMSFIGGAFTADNLEKNESQLNFIRMLLSPQLNQSQKLAAATVQQFNQQLNIPIAKTNDADYLKNNCLTTPSAGVYCRNLALCRKINSPLVYGESLYQDNEMEARALMKRDLMVGPTATNDRLHLVAKSYFEGLMAYLKAKP